MTESTSRILHPYLHESKDAIIITGCPIYDVTVSDNGDIKTLVSCLQEEAHKECGMVMVRYSLANGLCWSENSYGKNDQEVIKKALASNGIQNAKHSSEGCCGSASQELIDILKGIIKLSSKEYKWQDTRKDDMHFLFLIEFTSDVVPEANTPNQFIINELLYTIACSSSFRDRGHCLILSDIVEGRIDSKVRGVFCQTYIDYPNLEEKTKMIHALHGKYPSAVFEAGMTDVQVANLTCSTPNRTLESLFRASQMNASPIPVKTLVDNKAKDVEVISEGTLVPLDTSRVSGVSLVGDNIARASEFMFSQAEGLKHRDKSMEQNFLLAGAPGTGKTDLVTLLGRECQLPVYQMMSPKNGIVGETGRKARLQAEVFNKMVPALAFIDEVTEAFPTQRGTNLDSGASDEVISVLLNSLSDKSREGRSMLVGTTNCPWKMGAAMIDRFVVVPVIMPGQQDIPQIIASITKQISGIEVSSDDPGIIQAAKIFYSKHLMPRRIRTSLKYFVNRGLTPELIVRAANEANPLDLQLWNSAVYADLVAIRLTTQKSLYPWFEVPDYVFPDYIGEVVDGNGDIMPDKLNEAINRLEPYVNV